MPKTEAKTIEVTRIESILERLNEEYPRVKTSLVFDSPFQLLVATILSAQTTDEQVNKITKKLFQKIATVEDLAKLTPSELEPYLKSCGLYRYKSRYLIETARIIIDQFDGKVPDSFDQLRILPGVGRKTANVILSSAFNKPALAVDTHVFRVSRRLGLACAAKVEQVEEELKKVIPRSQWSRSHHRLIAHGRTLCHARKPLCYNCFLADLCLYAREKGDIDDLEKN